MFLITLKEIDLRKKCFKQLRETQKLYRAIESEYARCTNESVHWNMYYKSQQYNSDIVCTELTILKKETKEQDVKK